MINDINTREFYFYKHSSIFIGIQLHHVYIRVLFVISIYLLLSFVIIFIFFN